MGDRANIYLFDDRMANTEGALPPRTGIWLYTHWSGYRWPEALRLALIEAKPRWGDESYAARIIAREVFEDLDGETGGGISTRQCDNEYPILCVDLLTSRVGLCQPDDDQHNPDVWTGVMSFADFVALTEATWKSFKVDADV